MCRSHLNNFFLRILTFFIVLQGHQVYPLTHRHSMNYGIVTVGKDLQEHQIQPPAHFGAGFRNNRIIGVGNDLQDQVQPLTHHHRSHSITTLNRTVESLSLEETCKIISPTNNPSPPTELLNHGTIKVGNDLKSNH